MTCSWRSTRFRPALSARTSWGGRVAGLTKSRKCPPEECHRLFTPLAPAPRGPAARSRSAAGTRPAARTTPSPGRPRLRWPLFRPRRRWHQCRRRHRCRCGCWRPHQWCRCSPASPWCQWCWLEQCWRRGRRGSRWGLGPCGRQSTRPTRARCQRSPALIRSKGGTGVLLVGMFRGSIHSSARTAGPHGVYVQMSARNQTDPH